MAPGGPADRAGLRDGDIVVGYEGKKVTNITELRSMVAETGPGTRAQLEVFRDGKVNTLYAEIGELDSEVVYAHSRFCGSL